MNGTTSDTDRTEAGRDFIRQVIDRDLAAGKHPEGIVTRFPPEPNGFLHIGHAKSIVLNFGIAEEFGDRGVRARCHLRFDDTNPTTEDIRYVEAIREDVRWLGFDWGEHLYHASDYFEAMYGFAEELIGKGLAYVDSRSEAEIREGRGTVTTPGTPSPHRDRSVEENLDLFRRMRAGEFENGTHVLRGKIDMSSPNMLMRDPVLYRIRHAEHYRTGGGWCIYPLYDYAHPLEDALEGVTHSICTLEFENNRELYDWVVENTSVPYRPRQYEFARLNLDYTVMSKRKLLRLVQEGDVSGWDDPRMPTVAGLRRRGVTPEAIRSFCEMIGVAKADSRVDMGKLEYAIRDDLNRKAPRVLAVHRPLKVTLTTWPDGEVEWLDAPYYPHDVPLEGSRKVPFSGELFIEEDDFAEDPPPGFKRLVPGGEVRLRYGYVIRCDEVVKDAAGRVTELRCTHDPATRGGDTPDGRKVKGTIHWVSASHALPARFRLYDRLFTVPDPEASLEDGSPAGSGVVASGSSSGAADFRAFLNADSLREVEGFVEPALAEHPGGTRFQFERLGYFWPDPVDSTTEALVFNRIVTLRDSWGKDARASVAPVAHTPATPPPSPEPTGASAPSGPPLPPELTPDQEARARVLRAEFGMGEVEAAILARTPGFETFFRAGAASDSGGADALVKWVVNELPPVLAGRSPDALPFDGVGLAALVRLVEGGTVSSRGGKEILEAMAREGGDPAEWVRRLDLVQVSDDAALLPAVEEILAANPEKVAAYRGGKTGLLGFFMGQIMRATGGKADPERVQALLKERLEG